MPPITNPGGAFGYTNPEYPSGWKVDIFVAGGVITAGNVVALSTGAANQAIVALTNVDSFKILGVALDNAVTNGTVRVASYGPVSVSKGNGNFAAGNYLTLDATTAGVVAAITAGVTVATLADLGKFLGVVEVAATTGETKVKAFIIRP